MMISDITSKAHRNKSRKRVGRGLGSGHGKTSCRGSKGMGQHSTEQARRMTEGGQMPMFRRIPKRGFSNANFRVAYQVVNVGDLDGFDAGTKVTAALLESTGLIRDSKQPVKILGTGELKKKLEVEASKFSETAQRKITEAGGQAKVIE
jgi:large subunit ribosomal protein L15